MEREFELGDKVQLKSGGPTMTIDQVNPEAFGQAQTDTVRCVWFDGSKGPIYREFIKAALTLKN